MCNKMQELLILREHLGSPPDCGGVRVAHRFSFLCCVLFLLSVFILCPVYLMLLTVLVFCVVFYFFCLSSSCVLNVASVFE